MEFDSYTLLLLLRHEDAPKMEKAALDALQDAHLTLLARLRESGSLLAAGPSPGPDDRSLRGICLFGVDVERALALEAQDPAVLAGRFRVEAHPWIVPHGAMLFPPANFPRSAEDADR